MDTVHIECEQLVCIPAGLGIQQHIIFRPTHETHEAVRQAVREHATARITVDDETYEGTHESKRLHTFIGATTAHGTIILTTKEL